MKMNVINLSSKWEKIGSWNLGNPFSMFFVYPLDEAPYILKGGRIDCENHLQQNETRPVAYFRVFFHNGKQRGGDKCNFKNLPQWIRAYTLPISRYDNPGINKKYRLLVFGKDGRKPLLVKLLRRVPRCFPVEVAEIVKKMSN